MSHGVLLEHLGYYSDRVKLTAYSSAINSVFSSGDTVLDLGCGTGLLGLLACKAGASTVHAVDSTPNFYPFAEPRVVKQGESITCQGDLRPRVSSFSWRCRFSDEDAYPKWQSTLLGQLRSTQGLRKTIRGVPLHANAVAPAARRFLEGLEQGRKLETLRAELESDFMGAFASAAHREDFLRDMISRFARDA